MGDLGSTLRSARTQAGLSLSGMASRTGYSRSYLGNVETGQRQVTPDVIRAYERVLGEDLKRRQLLIGSLSILAAESTPDTALSIASDISKGRSELLAISQTSHATDKSIAALVARDTPSVASLVKWSNSSYASAVLRVNAAGILAKVRSPAIDNEAISVLQQDSDVRELYLTAVISRVLKEPWDTAYNMATTPTPLSEPDHLNTFTAELSNPADAGARYCSAVMLSRTKSPTVTTALVSALRTEPSRENLRAIGAALAGVDPLSL
ncbi:transcriptional regulator with XRE-family HTH domain [Catenuloplanes nepalensis]|uniref:Transcriptional regulator with XRE-family HTH domain n=1 Tax=Catenuloplanes nepalensis TaxID=587533 RepID=A0ABT9MVD3_9ACTN|nr:helix-turn-helix transcriptional regulator [Catenuloplanes nepalensis]MDP9795211.1 transcriptional regulator with XRE-family HTH domain [Catenuloplanes nepalensis]